MGVLRHDSMKALEASVESIIERGAPSYVVGKREYHLEGVKPNNFVRHVGRRERF